MVPNGSIREEYFPFAFSPDSNMLLLRSNTNKYYFFDLRSNKIIVLNKSFSNIFLPICDRIWSQDFNSILCSQILLAGGPGGIMIPGLWENNIDGTILHISAPNKQNESIEEKVYAPRKNINGEYLFLLSLINVSQENGSLCCYYLESLNTNHLEDSKILREDTFTIGQSIAWLWLNNGEGLLLEQYQKNNDEILYIPINRQIKVYKLIIDNNRMVNLKWGN